MFQNYEKIFKISWHFMIWNEWFHLLGEKNVQIFPRHSYFMGLILNVDFKCFIASGSICSVLNFLLWRNSKFLQMTIRSYNLSEWNFTTFDTGIIWMSLKEWSKEELLNFKGLKWKSKSVVMTMSLLKILITNCVVLFSVKYCESCIMKITMK